MPYHPRVQRKARCFQPLFRPGMAGIENGHIIKDKTGKEHGFKKGEHILEDSQKEFQDEFLKAADGFIDEVIKNGGF